MENDTFSTGVNDTLSSDVVYFDRQRYRDGRLCVVVA